MKRAEILESKGPLTIRSYDSVPDAPPKGVVVKTSFCGICHSDLHLWDDELDLGEAKFRPSDIPTYNFPIVLGHEIVGEIFSIGDEESNGFIVGEKVIVYPWIGCQNCGYCKAGESIYCNESTTSIGTGTDGGYSEFVVVSNSCFLVKVPESIPMDIACMLPCSALTTYNAVSKIKPTIEQSVKRKGRATLLIIGAGGLGLWCLQTARASLPSGTKIISADITTSKLENAKAHGADDTVLWDRSLSNEEIIKISKEKGAGGEIEAVIDFVNSGVTAPRAFGCLAKGGAMAMVGLFGGSLTLPLPLLALQIIQIHGVYVGTLQQLKELVDLVAKSEMKAPDLNFYKLEEVSDALIKLKKGEIEGRGIIKF